MTSVSESDDILTSVYGRWCKEIRQAGKKGVGDQGYKKDLPGLPWQDEDLPRSCGRD